MSSTSRWYCCRCCRYTRHRNSARCIVRATNVSATDVPTFANDADVSSWGESAVGAAIPTVRIAGSGRIAVLAGRATVAAAAYIWVFYITSLVFPYIDLLSTIQYFDISLAHDAM
jgi:hypothetical protein